MIAPPYDVIDAELQQRLYDKHPANVVRLILNRDEPGDDEHNNRYTRAARLLRELAARGRALHRGRPGDLCLSPGVHRRRRRRTRGAASCAACGSSASARATIYPHEETHGSAKADRLKLWTACKANLSQIFGLYPDPENAAQNLLEAAIVGVAPLEATDHLGVVHRIWPVTDVAVITEVIAAMGGRPVYIADGHHRYETACTLRDQLAAELAQRGETLPPEHPANYVLMMCVSMSDPGMLVLPRTGCSAACRDDVATNCASGWRRVRHRASRQRPGPRSHALGGNRSRRRPGHARPLHGEGRPVDDRPAHRRRPPPDGRSRRRPLGRLAGPGREHPAPAGDRHAPATPGAICSPLRSMSATSRKSSAA